MTSMLFKDNFSTQAGLYAKYRPSYPSELYEFLLSVVAARDLAWDCGTGNGQAAFDLAPHFKKVIATDPSKNQIAQIEDAPRNVELRVEQSEECSLRDRSVNLITVATALHWFDLDKFYNEAKRVLKKDGVIAAWGYSWCSINKDLDQMIHHFHENVVGEFWQPENRLLEKEYSTIPFPFKPIDSPKFTCRKKMTLDDFIGYLKTWSATQRFISKNNYDPTCEMRSKLLPLWGEADRAKTVSWNLTLKVGRLL